MEKIKNESPQYCFTRWKENPFVLFVAGRQR